MKRGKLRSIIKKVLVGMILVFSLVTTSFTASVYAKANMPYKLQESSIVYKENSKRVMLDMAHSDTLLDKGCSYGEYNERDIANKITLKVKQLLEAEGIEVTLTRNEGETISIAERIKLANSADYNYYISIHINSSGTENQGTGVEAWSSNAWSLSRKVLKELENEFNYKYRGIYASEFYNRKIDDKSTILEIGFLNNEYDRNNLVNHQDRYASAIARGIIAQLKEE
jgi:N-acetylmuramoyl-L-alanine amidase